MTKIFRLKPLTVGQAREICGWRYDPPYDVYQFPSWDKMVESLHEFADPEIRRRQYCGVMNEQGTLSGFAQFFPLAGLTRLGLGMRPDLSGRGLGEAFVLSIIEEANSRAPGQAIDLEVHAWNRRAFKVYERCGFEYEQTYEKMTPQGIQSFHCMVYRSETLR
ncbi:GNAT family N-acetyltransferase [Ferviditalea candida]|uniref:GNAT family N-acetyltransferase n=1 Tax=Ferviditalea candida TaxID=3108399 RepID=A0ABU5ZJN6_9BACL|nr:GNAT family N-acetyltransferase [Paenibacillaceae bacterium T2]